MSTYSVRAVLEARGVEGFAKAFQNAAKSADRLRSVAGGMKSVGKTMTAAVTLPVVGMGTAIVNTGAKFDDQMSTVQAVTGATGKQMLKLRDQSKDMGMSTRYSASQAAEGQEMLARAGFEVDEVVSALPSVLDLAAAGAVDLGDAADITSNILSGFGMEAKETARVADVLAKASADSNVDVQTLGEAFKYVGPVASSLGLSIEDTAASIGVLGDAGIQGGQAGRMLRSGLQSLVAPTEGAAKLMKDLGIEVFDANDELKPMPDVISELEDSLGDMSARQREAALETLFGSDAMSAWGILVNRGSDSLGEFSGELKDSEGVASEMHETMEDNLAGSFRNLMSALEGLSLSFYEMGDGALRDFIDWLTELVKTFIGLDDKTKQTIIVVAGIAAAIGPVLIVLGMLIESVMNVGSALRAISPIFGGLSLSMFAWIAVIGLVVAAIVGLWKTNEDFRNNIMEIWESVQTIIMSVFEALQPAISVFIGSLVMIVQALMPVISWVVEAAAAFIGWVAHVIETYSWVTTLIQVLAVVVSVIGGVIAVVAVLAKIFAVVMGVIKAVGAILIIFTNPIGIVIAAISGLVAVVVWLGGKFEWLGNLLDKVSNFMSNAWNKFLGFFGKGTEEAAEDAEDAIEGVSEKGKEDLEDLADSGVSSTEELQHGVTENVGEMSEASKGYLDELSVGGTESFENLNLEGVDAMSDMASGVTENIGDMSDLSIEDLQDLEISGLDATSGLGDGVTANVSDMTSEVKSQVGDMESSASGDFSGLSEDISANAKKVKESVSSSFSGMTKTVEKEMTNIKKASSNGMKGISTNVVSGMKQASQAIKSSMTGITSGIKKSFSDINRVVNTSTSRMAQEITRGYLSITRVTTTSFNTLTRIVDAGTKKQDQLIRSSMQRMALSYRTGFNQIRTNITSDMSRSTSVVNNSNTRMVSSVRSLHSQFYSAGVHAMAGLQRGLNARSGGVMATARNIANRIASTIRQALQVRSPSRITTKIGSFVGEGLVVGLEDMRRKVERASGALGLSAVPELEPMNITGQVHSAHSRTNRQISSHMVHEMYVSTSKQPAYIGLTLGGSDYEAFVDDITETQDRKVRIEKSFS